MDHLEGITNVLDEFRVSKRVRQAFATDYERVEVVAEVPPELLELEKSHSQPTQAIETLTQTSVFSDIDIITSDMEILTSQEDVIDHQ